MGSKQFKSLQAKWYRKLKEMGFEDIEKIEEMVRFHGLDFQTQYSPSQFKEKQTYYAEAKELLNQDIFLDSVERRIWALHTMGYSIRRIVGVLKCEGTKRDKNQINAVLNEFQKVLFK